MAIEFNSESIKPIIHVNHDHPGDEDPHKKDEAMLPLRQEQALEMMLEGISDGDIAQKLGVTRQTVNHWRNQDDHFRFKLTQRRLQTWESRRDELANLYQEAIAVMRKELKSRNAKTRFKAAAQILKMPALQDSLKNKGTQDLNKLEEENMVSVIKAAVLNVNKKQEEEYESKKRNENKRLAPGLPQPGHAEGEGMGKVEDRPCY